MKRFTFRLEKLLAWRRQRKESQSITVARRISELQNEESRLSSLAGHHEVTKDGLRRARAGVLDADQIIRSEAHDNWIRQSIDRQKRAVENASETLATEKEKLNDLACDEKLIEKLKQKRLEQHQREKAREEARHQNEIAGARHQRSRSDPQMTEEEITHA